MSIRLDHIVLWVEDPLRSADFYHEVVGLPLLRIEDFRAGRVLFPSVRVCADTIIDLMPKKLAASMNAIAAQRAPAAANSAGLPVNHVCLAMDRSELDGLRQRLDTRGVDTSMTMQDSFGARGNAPLAFYFHDPDGNVLEARYYE